MGLQATKVVKTEQQGGLRGRRRLRACPTLPFSGTFVTWRDLTMVIL